MFHETPPASDEDIAVLNKTLAHRVRRFLVRFGKVTEEGAAGDSVVDEGDALVSLADAAVHGRTPLGPTAGSKDVLSSRRWSLMWMRQFCGPTRCP